ncbi:hypothetical protein [Tenacibaculum amylolyticum]|uniref:hypothetical protein n=1 Tax=Tenacibaculum amylolyticum TaxID=104269 RepID=UPI0038963470
MKKLLKPYIISASIFIWIGFVGAISFMEAWLKFKATGVTQKIGLAIGSLVFNALNKVELVIATIIIIVILNNKTLLKKKLFRSLLLPFSILVFQSFYLLPILDERVQLIITNMPVKQTYDHFLYVFLEFIKVLALLIIGIQILHKNEYTY